MEYRAGTSMEPSGGLGKWGGKKNGPEGGASGPDERKKVRYTLGHVEQLGDVNRICAVSLSLRGTMICPIATAHLSQFLPEST